MEAFALLREPSDVLWRKLCQGRGIRFDRADAVALVQQWQRGFNQAELLAAEIGRKWNTPVKKIVRRQRGTAPQAGLTNAKRRLNVRGAFRIASGRRLDGLRILLVDDVVTTGATASACARVLKRAGAAHVSLLALARTDRRTALDETFLKGRGPSMIGIHQERLHRPVLVLNSSFEPINVCAAGARWCWCLRASRRRAFQRACALRACGVVPSVIRLLEYRRIPHQTQALSRRTS
jgi:hypothetical protein